MAEYLGRGWIEGEADILKFHFALDGGQWNFLFVTVVRFFRGIHHLDVLPDAGEAQQGLGDVAGNDAEGDQLPQAQLPLQHHGGAHPKHQQLGELLQHLGGFGEGRAGDRFLEGARDIFAVEVLPFPAADHLNVLGLHRLDASQHFNKVALGAGVFLGRITILTSKQGRPDDGEADLDRQHTQGNGRE